MSLTYFLTFIIGINFFSIVFYIVAIILRKRKIAPWVFGGLGVFAGIFLVASKISVFESMFLAAWSLLVFILLTVVTLIFLLVGHRKAKVEAEEYEDD